MAAWRATYAHHIEAALHFQSEYAEECSTLFEYDVGMILRKPDAASISLSAACPHGRHSGDAHDLPSGRHVPGNDDDTPCRDATERLPMSLLAVQEDDAGQYTAPRRHAHSIIPVTTKMPRVIRRHCRRRLRRDCQQRLLAAARPIGDVKRCATPRAFFRISLSPTCCRLS